ncbi:hypothetical protein PR048_004016 [Dryococelus australis]|uniref:SET domain-containing protein n=1 Tax=Dryococelus australis TaxID=614101 RepID=A0ABQ9I698_9NEOP|nr:hypothetical protein PR048_004016 [Dryococelus australis]
MQTLALQHKSSVEGAKPLKAPPWVLPKEGGIEFYKEFKSSAEHVPLTSTQKLYLKQRVFLADLQAYDMSEHMGKVQLQRATSSNLPMAMRFRHLKETSKEAVGVYRSHIHGRGLFCLRDIELGEMVIEYAGEVIRSTLTDKREKYYESKDIGCYMFRIDDHLVVDATMRGNAARFINHSCEVSALQ